MWPNVAELHSEQADYNRCTQITPTILNECLNVSTPEYVFIQMTVLTYLKKKNQLFIWFVLWHEAYQKH